MLFFKINKYLFLKLENGVTNIYVNNELFIQCKYLLLNIPTHRIGFIEEIKSIDEAMTVLDRVSEYSINNNLDISSETEFWGHCSNIQTWFENNYNTCLIHSNLAFPLLKRLTEAGDIKAKKVFKEEIAKKFEKGHLNTIQFLIENKYLDFLNIEELDCVSNQSLPNIITQITEQLDTLLQNSLNNYSKTKNLFELISFLDLRYNFQLFFQIFDNLSENLKKEFMKKFVLHLNYKEFNKYKIPYGTFFLYFEKLLNFIHRKYPDLYDLLKLIDTGYFTRKNSIDDAYSYGAV